MLYRGKFLFLFGFSNPPLLCLLFYSLCSFGVRVTCLCFGRWQNVKLLTPNNLCLHKCMILPMKMMTIMMPLKKNSQVPTSINVIIYESKPLNGMNAFVNFFHYSICMVVDMFFVIFNVAQGCDQSWTTYQRTHHLPRTSFHAQKRRFVQSIEQDFKMSLLIPCSVKSKRSILKCIFCVQLRFFQT